MNVKRFLSIALIGSVLVQTSACKKDDDTDKGTVNAEKLACSYTTAKTLTNRNPNGVDYYAECIVDISGNGALIIEPGTTIAFENAAGIYIGGSASIRATGSSTEKITFTTTGNTTSWAGIYIASTSSQNELSNCIVEYAGNGNHNSLYRVEEPAAVQVAGYAKIFRNTVRNSFGVGIAASAYDVTLTLPLFDQNTVTNSASYPIVVEKDLIKDLDLSTGTYTGNYFQSIKLICSSYSGTATSLRPTVSHVWRDAGIPYYINEGFVIGDGASLTLEQGVELLFDGDGYFHIVGGNSYLRTNGTSSNQVRMSGTNNTAGFWDGLLFETKSSNNILTHTTISDAGNNAVFFGSTKAAVRVGAYQYEGSLQMNNVTIQNSAGCGVAIYDADNTGQIPAGTTYNESNTIYSGNIGNDLCIE